MGSGNIALTPRGDYNSCVSFDIVVSTDTEVRKLFTYESDEDDEWDSYATEVLIGLPFEGDCEDFALTAADYMTAMGVARRHLYIATMLLDKEYYGPPNHAVLVVNTCKGQYVIDNARSKPVPISEYSEYNWRSIKRLDQDEWRDVTIVR